MFGGNIRTALVHAATRYDEKQSKKKFYNHYALAQYLRRIDDVCADLDAGADMRAAIVAGFTGPLLNAMLKAADLDKASRDEASGFGKAWTYQPVKNNQE
jgi:hypothetical protein